MAKRDDLWKTTAAAATPRLLILVALAILLILAYTGAWFYRTQAAEYRRGATSSLETIYRLKAELVADWRENVFGDAGILAESPFLRRNVVRYLQSHDPDLAVEISARFGNFAVRHNYVDILLVDPAGRIVLSLTGRGVPGECFAAPLARAMEHGMPAMGDLQRGPEEASVLLCTVTPVRCPQASCVSPAGAIVLVSDAARRLYPLVTAWPMPGQTGEAYLAERRDGSVLALSPLREMPDAALRLALPLGRTELPAVKAALGEIGPVQGTDYRGAAVEAVIGPIPDSSWFLVAKMDADEVYSQWHARARFITVIFVLAGGALACLAAAAWQVRRKAHYRQLYLAESRLLKFLERQRVTLQSVGEAILATDAQGLIELINPAAERLTGWTMAEAVDRPLRDIFQARRGKDFKPLPDPASEVVRLGEAYDLGEYVWLLAKDGAQVPIAGTASPIHDDRGGTCGVVLVLRDRTRERQAQIELRQAKEAAEGANRSKSDFLANMSHEIRTPLNGILGMIQLALVADLPPQTKEYLRLAVQSSDHLLAIINDILDLSKIDAGKMILEPKAFHLKEAVDMVARPLSIIARDKGVALSVRVATDVPARVVGDKGRLQQVLTNIVGNAVKFTRAGSVAVEVMPDEPGQGDEDSRLRLLFQVTDTGIGIPQEELANLFRSYATVTTSAHAEFGGTGLGLYISKSLVEMMGGTIEAESVEGVGSVFAFTAVFGRASDAGEGLAEPAPAEVMEPLRILVVEDNLVNCLFVVHILEDWGHRVRTAGNGREAIEELRREAFDVVLMDVTMPVMDGEQTVRAIRAGQAGNPRVPVVALTAHALAGDRERFLASGMDAFVSKPIQVDELRQVLAEMAQRARATTA